MKNAMLLWVGLSVGCSLAPMREGGAPNGSDMPDAGASGGSDSGSGSGSACAALYAGIWLVNPTAATLSFRLVANNAYVSAGVTGVHWTKMTYAYAGGATPTSLDSYASADGYTLTLPATDEAACGEIDVSYVDACGNSQVASYHPTPGMTGGCSTDAQPAVTQCDPSATMTIDGVADPAFTRACTSSFAFDPGEDGTSYQFGGWPTWRYSDIFIADFPGASTGRAPRTYLPKNKFISLELHAMDTTSLEIIGTDTYEDAGVKVSISTQPGRFSKFVTSAGAFSGTDGVDPTVVCECDQFEGGCFHLTDDPNDPQYASTNCKLTLGGTYYVNFAFATDAGANDCTATGLGFAGDCRVAPVLYAGKLALTD